MIVSVYRPDQHLSVVPSISALFLVGVCIVHGAVLCACVLCCCGQAKRSGQHCSSRDCSGSTAAAAEAAAARHVTAWPVQQVSVLGSTPRQRAHTAKSLSPNASVHGNRAWLQGCSLRCERRCGVVGVAASKVAVLAGTPAHPCWQWLQAIRHARCIA